MQIFAERWRLIVRLACNGTRSNRSSLGLIRLLNPKWYLPSQTSNESRRMNHASTGETDEYFTKQTNKYENASAPPASFERCGSNVTTDDNRNNRLNKQQLIQFQRADKYFNFLTQIAHPTISMGRNVWIGPDWHSRWIISPECLNCWTNLTEIS